MAAVVNTEVKFFPSQEVFTKLSDSLRKTLIDACRSPTINKDTKKRALFLLYFHHEYDMLRWQVSNEEFNKATIKVFVQKTLMHIRPGNDIHVQMYDKKTVDHYPFTIHHLKSIEIVERWADESLWSEPEFPYVKLMKDEYISMIEQRRELVRVDISRINKRHYYH
jgi:hypothetical protein